MQGFLGPGHVCTIMGYREYEPISERYQVPIVVTGFEPIDLLEGTLMVVRQLEAGRAVTENQYSRVLDRDGNSRPRKLVNSVFEVCDRKWRGVGWIPKSGYKLRWEYREHDAERLFEVSEIDTKEPAICISGQILKGIKKPHDCPAFGTLCTPQNPLGATMVSAEGACAAYYAYGRHLQNTGRSQTRNRQKKRSREASHERTGNPNPSAFGHAGRMARARDAQNARVRRGEAEILRALRRRHRRAQPEDGAAFSATARSCG